MTAGERRVLDFNPWGYDETRYRVLENRMVVTRWPHECAICLGAIPAASRVRVQCEVLLEDRPSRARSFYFCPECCRVMANDRDGEGIAARYDLGCRNAVARQSQRSRDLDGAD